MKTDVRVAGICIVVALALSLCACGRESASNAPPSENVYRMPLTDNPVALDPALFTDVNSEGVARRIFNGLVRFDQELNIVPDLAESWNISDDGLVYTFHLRKGVQFHHGRALTSQDVRYSFERLLRKDTLSHRAELMEPIAGAEDLREDKEDHLAGLETPDENTVILRLKRPFSPMLNYLAMGNASIVPQDELQRMGRGFSRSPVGTGPFRFVSWRDNDVIELARNDDYFGQKPALDGLRFRVIKEPLVAYREYLAGRLEHCAVPEGYLSEVLEGPLAKELRSTPNISTYYLGITMTHDPCGSNVNLRRALNYAVDRKFLCEKVLGGSHVPAKGVLPPGLPGYEEDAEGYTYDPDRAKEELRKAGYGPGGRNLPELTLYFNPRAPGMQVAQAVQEDFKRIGIRVGLNPMELAALLDATNKGTPELFRLSWMADFPDADNFLMLFHSKLEGSAGNRAHYNNPEIDVLLDRSRQATSEEERIGLLREVHHKVVADAPWIFLSHPQTHLMVKPYVHGMSLTPMDVGTSVNIVDFTQIRLN